MAGIALTPSVPRGAGIRNRFAIPDFDDLWITFSRPRLHGQEQAAIQCLRDTVGDQIRCKDLGKSILRRSDGADSAVANTAASPNLIIAFTS